MMNGFFLSFTRPETGDFDEEMAQKAAVLRLAAENDVTGCGS